MTSALPNSAEVVVVGAGPAGSAAAAWLARAGVEVLLTDAAVFPRDKTCGDGLTPRAVAELIALGLEDWLRARPVNQGLRAHGFGQVLELSWPGGSLPAWGSAVPRTELDDHLRTTAIKAGAHAVDGVRAIGVQHDGAGVSRVVFRDGRAPDSDVVEVGCRWLVVADGVRSPLGKVLGRTWHRDTVYGVAGRCYVTSARADDRWISSHLELRDPDGAALPGYGWVFPLGNDTVNLGAGMLATAKRPATVAIKPLMRHYAAACREEFGLGEELRAQASALLPMGGAVSGVAGANWALIGDAAACVNPLNGEGIDYGLETGRLVAGLIADHADLETVWPATLREHYGEAFSVARRLAGVATMPRLVSSLGPAGMRSNRLMTLALRWMGNLVDAEDRDRTARLWRWAGRRSLALDHRPPFT
ncbi:MAG: geranylgeranyl reductase family protein [Nocardioides sp.]|uniref:geranylgeranyl reductase family protein n=1 Tax=Nocardioides sp. TaxID=35761 RepID=UPI0039E4993C